MILDSTRYSQARIDNVGSYYILLGINKSTWPYYVLLGRTRQYQVLLNNSMCYQVLPGITMYHQVLLGTTWYHSILLRSRRYYYVLLDTTRYQWTLLDTTSPTKFQYVRLNKLGEYKHYQGITRYYKVPPRTTRYY